MGKGSKEPFMQPVLLAQSNFSPLTETLPVFQEEAKWLYLHNFYAQPWMFIPDAFMCYCVHYARPEIKVYKESSNPHGPHPPKRPKRSLRTNYHHSQVPSPPRIFFHRVETQALAMDHMGSGLSTTAVHLLPQPHLPPQVWAHGSCFFLSDFAFVLAFQVSVATVFT